VRLSEHLLHLQRHHRLTLMTAANSYSALVGIAALLGSLHDGSHPVPAQVTALAMALQARWRLTKRNVDLTPYMHSSTVSACLPTISLKRCIAKAHCSLLWLM
jgi:hypothetical protein